MYIAVSLILGAMVGWLASLVLRAGSNEEILLDMIVGAAGGLLLAELLGNRSIFDSSLAACLGAAMALAILTGVRRLQRRT